MRPNAGFSTRGSKVLLKPGDGREFQVRTGPDYKRNGKKAASEMNPYDAVAVDCWKRSKAALFHVASRITLPPPPDAPKPNDSGLPRRLVVCAIVPADGPSLLSSKTDGPCYQVTIVFTATAAKLKAWLESGAPAARLFARWAANVPAENELKERFKLLPKMDNIAELGLGWVEKWNGKPALITKSGSTYAGDDYLEIDMNTHRFGMLTRKGVHSILPRVPEMQLHVAVTIEGRDDDEMPEQITACARLSSLDLINAIECTL